MSVEDRLEQARTALDEMWSDEAATAERLHRFLTRTRAHHDATSEPDRHAPAAAPANMAEHTAATVTEPTEANLVLCSTASHRAAAADRNGTVVATSPHRLSFKSPSGSRSSTADGAAAEIGELVERAQAGEADAFGRLYDQYSDTVYRYIYYRVGGKAT
ncbi:hypothetical protein ACF063_42585, partial [Streptomyces chartreusis]